MIENKCNLSGDRKTDSIKILLIEDNPDHIELINDVIAEVDGALFDIVCADRLSSGLELLAREKINVVLLDLFLPDSSGIKTFLNLHRQAPDIPVIVLSVLGDQKQATEAVAAGAQDYLIKGQIDGRLLGRSIFYAIERKLMMKKLTAEKERLTATITSIAEGFISTDIDGRVILLNKKAEELTGWLQDEAIGRPLPDVFNIINQKNQKRCENPVERILKDGHVIGLANHTVLVARDGTERIISDNGAPIQDKNGKIWGVVLVFRDIAEEQRVEKSLQRAQQLESIGVLAGGIAHDFNNILTAVLGNVSLAKTAADSKEDVNKLLTEAEKATMRASDLTRQLLTFSKEGTPIRETASIAELIKDSVSFALRGSKARCQYNFTKDSCLVEIDQGQLSQVISNLIINADQAMPGGGTIKLNCENISITAKDELPLKDGKYVRITVKDQGYGIPEEHLEKIFDPYFTTKPRGSGLGLTSVCSIIKKHNGHIGVESNAGVGTAFSIYLPVSQKNIEKKDEIKTPKEEKIKKKPRLSKGNILVLEDEESVRTVLVNMLKKIEYNVAAVTDGTEVIELYTKAKNLKEPYDVIIMDLTIPGGMGGQETIRRLLEIDPGAKAIATSGYSDGSIMADFRKHGFSGFVAKPYKMQEVSKVVRELITGIRE
jgi:PAS domain S-box-containing protein